jgi:phosphoglycolate phosphatase-like HAD superfamily hydrolase
MISNIIFDLDGTLIDSASDVIECLVLSYIKIKIPVPVINEKEVMGPPLLEIIQKLSPDIDSDTRNKLILAFRNLYDNLSYDKTSVLDGAYEALNKLNLLNKSMFIATSKAKLPVYNILTKFNMIKFFKDIVTVDIYENVKLSKNDMIKHIIDKHALIKNQTIIIGDTISDIEAGKKNNILSIAFTEGYGSKESLIQSNPDFMIDNLHDLLNIIK